MSSAPRVPPSGVWCPAVTAFDENDELDLETQAQYYAYLSRSGLTGLVILGTNSETFLLTREERAKLVATARRAVPAGFPLMAGVGAHSTKQVLEHISDAAAAGADYALVLPPAYFKVADMGGVVDRFFDELAARSPLPMVIYNFPGVCNGLDLSSTQIAALAIRHPGRIVGVKLTCGSVAKITRLAAELPPDRFAIFGGQSDFLIGGLAVGSAGCIAAFANVFPKTISRIYALYRAGRHDDALELHRIAALAEVPCKSGIASTKYAVSAFSAPKASIQFAWNKFKPRHPYAAPDADTKKSIVAAMKILDDIEKTL